jgi:hypothetical protein
MLAIPLSALTLTQARLDLSDAAKFFSVYVPIRALNCASLKYSIAALAAKQLGRVKGSKSCTGRGMLTSPATTETYPNSEQVDWFLKAANYYYLSVSDLTTSTSDGYSVVSTSAVLDSPIDLLGRWLNTQSAQGAGQSPDDGAFLRKTEEILATVTVLTLYKLLDAKGEEWHMYVILPSASFHSAYNGEQVPHRHSSSFQLSPSNEADGLDILLSRTSSMFLEFRASGLSWIILYPLGYASRSCEFTSLARSGDLNRCAREIPHYWKRVI